jgi:peptidoglycan-N-acetylmuramic acid deacetylase
MKRILIAACAAALMLGLCGCEPNVGEDGVAGSTSGNINTTPSIGDSFIGGDKTDNTTSSNEITSSNTTPENSNTAGGDNTADTGVTTASTMSFSGDRQTTDLGTCRAVGGETPTAFYFGGNAVKLREAIGNKKIGWGIGPARDDKNRPVDAVDAQEKYGKYDAVFIGEPDRRIYLTFDEGYENGFTGQILDTLAEKGVKATFFCTSDYCKSEPDLVRRMIDEGHVLGNHSWAHYSMPDCTDAEALAEITKLHDYVAEHFGYEMNLFRPPMGEFSERTLDITAKAGYKSVLWSFAYRDWERDKQTPVEEALAKMKESTHPGEIVLLHAVSSTNAEALPVIIDYWQSLGYEMGLIQ